MTKIVDTVISFKAGDLSDRLQSMLDAKGLSRSDFYKRITGLALELHESGDDPLAILNDIPIGGISGLNVQMLQIRELAVASHRALDEIKSGLAPVWHVMVGTDQQGDHVLVQPINTAENLSVQRVFEKCDALLAQTNQISQALAKYLTAKSA